MTPQFRNIMPMNLKKNIDYNEFFSALCKTIINQMERKKISFYRLNKDTGISRITLAKIKKNDLSVAVKTLALICHYLELELKLQNKD